MCGKCREITSSNIYANTDPCLTGSKILSDKDEHFDAIASNNSFNKKHLYQLGNLKQIY